MKRIVLPEDGGRGRLPVHTAHGTLVAILSRHIRHIPAPWVDLSPLMDVQNCQHCGTAPRVGR